MGSNGSTSSVYRCPALVHFLHHHECWWKWAQVSAKEVLRQGSEICLSFGTAALHMIGSPSHPTGWSGAVGLIIHAEELAPGGIGHCSEVFRPTEARVCSSDIWQNIHCNTTSTSACTVLRNISGDHILFFDPSPLNLPSSCVCVCEHTSCFLTGCNHISRLHRPFETRALSRAIVGIRQHGGRVCHSRLTHPDLTRHSWTFCMSLSGIDRRGSLSWETGLDDSDMSRCEKHSKEKEKKHVRGDYILTISDL